MTSLTLEERFRRNLSRYRLFRDGAKKIVVAVSTGVDSMTLLHLLERVMEPSQLIVAHVNHELRPESQNEEAYIRRYCRAHHLQVIVAHWPSRQHPETGIESAARQFRYAFFDRVMTETGATTLVTAHHQNDQAETMLMKLVRGGQLSQLTAMAWERPFGPGRLVRPLLNISKSDLIKYARDYQIQWFEDVTNQDLSLQRNQFRHQVIPALQTINPQVLDHLTDYRDQLAVALSLANDRMRQLLTPWLTDQLALKVTGLAKRPANERQMLLQFWLEHYQQVMGLSQAQLRQLDELAQNIKRPQTHYELGAGRRVVKQYDCLQVVSQKSHDCSDVHVQDSPTVLKLNRWYQVSQTLVIGAFEPSHQGQINNGQQVSLWIPRDRFPLSLRRWRSDDRIRLKNGHHQRVRRVLIDQKVSQPQRQFYPLIVDCQDEVWWIPGYKTTWIERPSNYRVEWRPIILAKKEINQEEKFDE